MSSDFSSITGRLLMGAAGPAVLLTSVWPKEGKTFTALNLSANLALHGKKTLLVDANTDRPRTSEIFGLSRRPGLLESLDGAAASWLEHCIAPLEGFYVLGVGQGPDVDAFEVVKQGMAEFQKNALSDFNFVVIDGPSLANNPLGELMLKAVDGVLLVVNAKRTTRKDVQSGVDVIRGVGSKLAGTVLNEYREYIPAVIRSWL